MTEAGSHGSTQGKGYLAAWLGAVVGGALGAVPGIVAGVAIADATSSGFDEIGSGVTYAAYGLFLGAWVGASLGCWAGLRLRRHDAAGSTAAALALLLLAGWVLWAFVLIDAGDALAVGIPLVAAATAPLVARSLAPAR